MELAEIIAEQNKESKGEQIALSDDGFCQMTIDGEHTVMLERSLDEQSFYLYAAVGAVPPDGQDVLSRLLAGNLFGKETGRAVLALDEVAQMVVLFERFEEHGLSYQDYQQRFEEFLQYLAYWKESITSTSASNPSS